MRERVERMAADLDLVTREEFDAVRTMAANARAGQEELAGKVASLEARLAAQGARPSSRPPSRAAPARRVNQASPRTPEGWPLRL